MNWRIILNFMMAFSLVGLLSADAEERQKVHDKANEYRREEGRKLEELGRWCLKSGLRVVGYRVLEESNEAWGSSNAVKKLLKQRDTKEEKTVAAVEIQKEYLGKRARFGETMCKKWAKVAGWARKHKMKSHGENAKKRFYLNLARTIGVLYTDPESANKNDTGRDFLEMTVDQHLASSLRQFEKLTGLGHDPDSGLHFHVVTGEAIDGKFIFDTKMPDRLEVFLGNWNNRSKDDGTRLTDAVCRALAFNEAGAENWNELPLWFRAGFGGLCTGQGELDFKQALQLAGGRLQPILDGLDAKIDNIERLETRAESYLVFLYLSKNLSDEKMLEFMNMSLTSTKGLDKALQKFKLPRKDEFEKAVYKLAVKLYGPKR